MVVGSDSLVMCVDLTFMGLDLVVMVSDPMVACSDQLVMGLDPMLMVLDPIVWVMLQCNVVFILLN